MVTNQALKKFCEESCGLQFRVLLVRRLHQGYFQRDCVAYRLLCGDETGELLDKAAALGRGEWGSIQRTSPIVVEKVFCRCFCCYCHSYPHSSLGAKMYQAPDAMCAPRLGFNVLSLASLVPENAHACLMPLLCPGPGVGGGRVGVIDNPDQRCTSDVELFATTLATILGLIIATPGIIVYCELNRIL